MNGRTVGVVLLAALIAPAAAGARSGGNAITIRGTSVNRDRSVTIAWRLEGANVFNSRITVDGAIVRSGSDQATIFTTRPLSGGSHTIGIEVREFFESYTASGQSCVASGGHWVCVRSSSSWTIVDIPYDARCMVPRVVGLRLAAARSRITSAMCSLGTVERVRSKQPAGVVLAQRPAKTNRGLPAATAIGLVISVGGG